MPDSSQTPAISVRDLTVGFGEKNVLDGLSLDVRRGEILGLVGASGGGKSVLLRTIIGLIPPREGRIVIMGAESDYGDTAAMQEIGRHWGILFQQGALFSSLTVQQNVQFPMRENLEISQTLLDELATAKLEMVGLSPDDGNKFPSELSGGMTKRAALARALALDPEIVFLDEPTSGLDPLGTRWMGLSAPGVGIHGTPSDASIGYSASHGCIRMHIPQAEWLFNHVEIGTTVFIVSA